jgi:hypothetical protein
MKLSEDKKAALYKAVSDPIMDLRVENQTNTILKDDMDLKLFHLNNRIHLKVMEVLNIKEG